MTGRPSNFAASSPPGTPHTYSASSVHRTVNPDSEPWRPTERSTPIARHPRWLSGRDRDCRRPAAAVGVDGGSPATERRMSDAATIADLVEDRFGSRVELAGTTAGAATLARVLARRTPRRYADRPVPEELLQTLFACAFP